MFHRLMSRGLLIAGCVLFMFCSFVAGTGISSAKRSPSISQGQTWHIVQSPNAGPQNELTAVDSLSPKDAWAVGDYHVPEPSLSKTLTEHWNGSNWSVMKSPNTGVADALSGVAMVASNDVWAVGNYFDSQSVGYPLIEHWNGTRWNIVSSPLAGAPAGTTLASVAAVSSNNVWAVGHLLNGAGIFQTLTLHWNGKQWRIVNSPNVGAGNNMLSGVAAVSARDVWAVGVYDSGSLVEHWNGKTWQVIPSPTTGGAANILTSVTAIASNDVWAVGNYNGTTLTEHWNGTNWAIIKSPSVANNFNFLLGVSASASANVWAVGYYYNVQSPDRTLILRWNGTLWRIVASPNQGQDWNQLYGVTSVSASSEMAIGFYYSTSTKTKTLIEARG
jgi:hypothetical protein